MPGAGLTQSPVYSPALLTPVWAGVVTLRGGLSPSLPQQGDTRALSDFLLNIVLMFLIPVKSVTKRH